MALALTLPVGSMTSCSNVGTAAGASVADAERRGAVAPGSSERFRKDQRNTRAQGTFAGAGLGALAGAIIGNQRGQAGRGALIGGVLGGLGGLAAGNAVADRKAAAVMTDVSYDVQIQDAAAANRSARAKVRSLRSQLATLQRQIASARAANDARALTRARTQLRQMSAEADREEVQLNSAISSASRARSSAGRSHPQFSGLNRGITEATEARSEVEGTRREIASLLNQID